MRYSRRTFLQIGTFTLPALNLAPAELLSSSTQTENAQNPLDQADRQYQMDLRVYAAKASSATANNLKQWIDKSSPKDIARATWARYEVEESAEKLRQAKSNQTEREKELASLKSKNNSRIFSPTLRQETAAERRAQIKAAENNVNNARAWLGEATLDAEKAAREFDDEFPRSPTGLYELLPTTINSSLDLDPNPPEQVDLFLCALYTSNRGLGGGKPWRNSLSSSGTLSLSVRYTVPGQPDCHPERDEEATVLYDIVVANGKEVDQITYGPAFANLQLKPKGKLIISVRLLNLSDASDDGFLNRVFSIAKRAWPIARPFVNAFGGVGNIVAFVDQLETLALRKSKTQVVWERHLSKNNGVVLSTSREGGTHLLRPGYYVFADKETDLEKHLLDVRHDQFKIYHAETAMPPQANYLVFGITKANKR